MKLRARKAQFETDTGTSSQNKKGRELLPPFLVKSSITKNIERIFIMSECYLTASFSALPAANLGTFLAAILIGLPV